MAWHAECHRHNSVNGSHCSQPFTAIVHELKLQPQLVPWHSVVGLLKINEAGPQLCAALSVAASSPPVQATALHHCAESKDGLLCAALPSEAKLALCMLARCLSMVADSPLQASCVQLASSAATAMPRS